MQHVPIAFNINNRILQIPAHRLFLFPFSLNTDPAQFHLVAFLFIQRGADAWRTSIKDWRWTKMADSLDMCTTKKKKKKSERGKNMKIKKKAMCVYISRRWCIFYFFSGVQLAKRPAGEMLSSKRLDFFPSPNPTIVWPVCPLLTRWWPNHLFFLPPLFVPFPFFFLFCFVEIADAMRHTVKWLDVLAWPSVEGNGPKTVPERDLWHTSTGTRAPRFPFIFEIK